MLKITKKEIVENIILKDQTVRHDKGVCYCDLTEGGNGFCYAGQYLEGVISVDDVINNLGGIEIENNDNPTEKTYAILVEVEGWDKEEHHYKGNNIEEAMGKYFMDTSVICFDDVKDYFEITDKI